MAISLVEVEIWYILIFNVTRRIHVIILLQSVTVQCCRLFWHISYHKVRQSHFITKCDRLSLQSASDITECDRLLLQSESDITKCNKLYYKVRQVLQSAAVITKWDVTPFRTLDWVSSITQQHWWLSKFKLCSTKESIKFWLLTKSCIKNLFSIFSLNFLL